MNDGERLRPSGLQVIGRLLERDPDTEFFTVSIDQARAKNLIVYGAQPILLQASSAWPDLRAASRKSALVKEP